MRLTEWAKEQILKGNLQTISKNDDVYVEGLSLVLERVSKFRFEVRVMCGNKVYCISEVPFRVNVGDSITIEEDRLAIKIRYEWGKW